MARPDLSYINHLHDLFIAKYERYLPTAFSDNLTLLQKVNMVIERMNQIGEITNELVDKWNEINKWLINDGLTEEVNKKINELVKDGTLADMINDELLQGIREELSYKVDNFNFKKEIDRIDKRIDDVTVYPDGVPKNEIVQDVINTINKDLLSDLENKVIDGGFNSGSYYDHFISRFGTGTFTENGTAILTSGGTHNTYGGTLEQPLLPSFPRTDKWYTITRIKTLNTGISDLFVGFHGDTGFQYTRTGERDDIRFNHYYTLSHLFDYNNGADSEDDFSGEFKVRVGSFYPSGSEHEGKSIEIDYVMALNLTEIFGVGNEPSKETMDFFMSLIPEKYFDGKLGAGRASTLSIRISNELIKSFNEMKESNIKNMVKNGMFERTTPSGQFYWTHNNTERNTEKSVFSMIGLGVNSLVQLYQITDTPYIEDEKIYLAGTFKVLNDDTISIGLAIDGTDISGVQTQEYTPKKNVDEFYSHIFSLKDGEGNVRIQYRSRFSDNETSQGKRVDVSKPIALNLTKIFGKGNEPTKEQIDRIILGIPDNWFNDYIDSNELLKSTFRYIGEVENEIIELDRSDITNAIYNPTFRDNPFGWITDGTSWNRENGVFSMTGNGSTNLIRVYQTTTTETIENKKLYVQATFIPRNDLVDQVGLAIYGNEITGGIHYVTSRDIVIDKPITLRALITMNDIAKGNINFQFRSVYTSAQDSNGKTVDVINPLMIDLSETFGFGNEPSQEMIYEFMDTYKDNFFEKNASVKEIDKAHFKMFMSGNFVGSNTPPLMVITIDDSFENDYSVLYPEFKKRGLNATSYVVPDWIDNRSGFMSPHQLKEMQDTGWDIQCHTTTHPRLGELTEQEIRQEFIGVNEWFETHNLGIPKHHAFPYGSTNSMVKQIGMEYRKTLRNIGAYSDIYNTYKDIEWNSLSAKAIDNLTDEEIETRKEELKEVIKVGGLHIVICHKIVEEITGDYQCKLSHLLDIVDTFISMGGRVVTMNEAYEIVEMWNE